MKQKHTPGPWQELRSGTNPHGVLLGDDCTVIAFINSGAPAASG